MSRMALDSFWSAVLDAAIMNLIIVAAAMCLTGIFSALGKD